MDLDACDPFRVDCNILTMKDLDGFLDSSRICLQSHPVQVTLSKLLPAAVARRLHGVLAQRKKERKIVSGCGSIGAPAPAKQFGLKLPTGPRPQLPSDELKRLKGNLMKIQRLLLASLFVLAVSSMSFAGIINPISASVGSVDERKRRCGLVSASDPQSWGTALGTLDSLGDLRRAMPAAECGKRSRLRGIRGDVDQQHQERQDYFQEIGWNP